jgi:periplasmic protein TonB
VVESYPIFPGGDKAMFKYLADNIKYPLKARETGVEGKVLIGFTLTNEGFVANVYVKSGIGGGCDEEARRVVASMPQWVPATQMGKKVAIQFTLPITFKLG